MKLLKFSSLVKGSNFFEPSKVPNMFELFELEPDSFTSLLTSSKKRRRRRLASMNRQCQYAAAEQDRVRRDLEDSCRQLQGMEERADEAEHRSKAIEAELKKSRARQLPTSGLQRLQRGALSAAFGSSFPPICEFHIDSRQVKYDIRTALEPTVYAT